MPPLKLNRSLLFFKDSCLYFLILVRLKIASILFTPFLYYITILKIRFHYIMTILFLCVTIQAGGI